MAAKILKTERGCIIPSRLELELFIEKHNLALPAKISIKYKVGKRRKLKSMRLIGLQTNLCEYCGSHTYMSYSRGGKSVDVELF
jgi:hypothetical protein